MDVPYNPTFALLSTYSKEMKIYFHTETCIKMLRAALFVIAKNWKPPKCPSTGEW